MSPIITLGSASKRGFGGGGSNFVTNMSELQITGNGPSYNSSSTAWGWIGPGVNINGPYSPYFSINLTNKKFLVGLRFILQAAGGCSSNNDGDGDSSGNSGATQVFDIPATGLNGTINVYLGPAGPNLANSGGNYINVNPRTLPTVGNPLGAYGVSSGQSGFTGNAAFDSAVLFESTIIGYAEGGAATVNYDSPNGSTARPWYHPSYVTSIVLI
jgi:hypothetical protein